eukprot:jgi/Ulvmu1/4539/UM002_0265.1
MNTVKSPVSSPAFCRPAPARFQPLGPRRVSACVLAPPKGVTEPSREPVQPPANFGFVYNAERLNSRACMIGFFALIALEAIIHKGLLEAVGITVGQGLGFEF